MTKGNCLRALNLFGKFLLGWFVLETLLYYWSGHFFTELDDVLYFFRIGSYGEGLGFIIMIAVSGLAIVVMGPFLLEGKWVGIFLAILYMALGNTINPFWYVFPSQWQGTPDEPTTFLSVINVTWYGIVLIGIAGFFYFKRWKAEVEPQADRYSDRGSLIEEGEEKVNTAINSKLPD